MGVTFSHGDARWSHTGFHAFRSRLAVQIGMSYSGISGPLRLDGHLCLHANTNTGCEVWDDPIVPLLDHSNCNIQLTPDECKTVAPRLRELVDEWGNFAAKLSFSFSFSFTDRDRELACDQMMGRRLASAMEKCAAAEECLTFQ